MSEQFQASAQVGVSVLIRRGDEFLLERRAHVHGDGTWGPPSGHIDFSETPEETARRETEEETGVTIDNMVFLGVTNDVFENEQKHYVTLWFDASYQSGEARVKAPEEESEVGWFHRDALPQPLFLPLQHLLAGNMYISGIRG